MWINAFVEPGHTQSALLLINIEVQRYIMTILWPLVYTFLNSIHKGVRVSNLFLKLVISLHILSLFFGLIWYYNYIPKEPERYIIKGLFTMRFHATLIFLISILTSFLSYLWFIKEWSVFNLSNKSEKK